MQVPDKGRSLKRSRGRVLILSRATGRSDHLEGLALRHVRSPEYEGMALFWRKILFNKQEIACEAESQGRS
jgi:hypothetical protein